uniref:CC-NBS-LRR type disease resistance protein NLR1-V n=1 Tax=Dasypyrum villosum TaxID=40247 RepID=A0A2R3ZVA7_9POAL|nr:powdery mildew resistance protein PM21 [Dasypyrum villosum]AVR54594.1 PM21 [Dasypyrum villosum]AVR54596.1 PM21 [Dasypyrum villosum]AVR54603.1 PM21 [Dasypyrum villosum]AVR59184.1 CC-NBS-LRR type disease resistance protein NLR1-V [Dasypyrum villosum]
MSAPVVSATMGAMNPLIGKLAALIGDEYKKLTGVRRQASFLKDELSAMKALLEKLELMDELDPLAKNWRDYVREMSYDMENCIDDFMRDLGGADAKTGFIKKTAKRLKTLRKRHRIADRMEELKGLALQANERRMRYKIDDCANSTNRVVPIDTRMLAIYKQATGLVGIDGPKKELVSWLTDTQEKLKVVAIVGFGGLGKTTLAKQVYDTIGGQFSCKIFFSVSQRPDMSSLLRGLQSELNMEEELTQPHEVQHIIGRLREYLTHKRYLIVVDDLWYQSTWNIMSCIFPEVGNGSRVIVTTRVEDVAIWACRDDHECVYRMEPLKEQDSRMLFCNRVFGSGYACPLPLKKVSDEILKKCGGLPLAIITIASLLASRQARSDEWESIRNCLGAKLAINSTLEEMRSILNLSYMHLPLHLRPCLLYFGMYPEDKIIRRRDMVLQWVAEGFVNNSHGSNLEDVAESYFNELINRSLIQPGESIDGKIESYKVHDMMLDLILSKCAENNFISVAYNCEDVARMHGREYKVRRLSLTSSANDATSENIHTSMQQIRSFSCFGEPKYTPPLLLFKYLRVLVFISSDAFGPIVDLTAIGQLFQLRYVKVSASYGIDFPTEFRKLVHLETLEVSGFSPSIPSDIVCLPRLSRLILPCLTRLPQGIANIKSLRALHCMEHISLEDINGLGELTSLRELRLYTKMVAGEVDALVSLIGKLHDLKYLAVSVESSKHHCDPLYSLSNPPLHIEELDLYGWTLKRVPTWIGDLHFLRILDLCVYNLLNDEVHVVGNLPCLVHLRLRVFAEGGAVICTGLFQVLKVLRLFSHDVEDMQFQIGLMPSLRQLTLEVNNGWGGAVPRGMEHLLALDHISVFARRGVNHRDVESAFRSVVDVHPRQPSLEIIPDVPLSSMNVVPVLL